MIVELQRSTNESIIIRHQSDPNDIDHNKQSKTKSARLSCLTYHIVSKLDNKATDNHTENVEEDIQKTLKQTDDKHNFAKSKSNIYHIFIVLYNNRCNILSKRD